MKVSKLKLAERNPRQISDEALARLGESIVRDPEFMELRPLILDNNNVVRAGNQRLKAIRQQGFKDIPDSWIRYADNLTPEQLQRFQLVDNAPSGMAGDWDLQLLTNDWNMDDLEKLGFDTQELEDALRDAEMVLDPGAQSSQSGGHGVNQSVTFWIYDHKITDGRDHIWAFIQNNMDRIRNADPEKLADAIVRAVDEILD